MVKSVVSWSKDIEGLKSGREYLVATYYSGSLVKENAETATYHIAKWYNEGDMVRLPKKSEKSSSEMTAEEKLLRCIFGFNGEVEVTSSGFYEETRDLEMMSEKRIAEGYLADLLWLGDEFYWSELPVAPKGLITQDEWNEKLKINRKLQRERELESVRTEVNLNLEYNVFSEGMKSRMLQVLEGFSGSLEDEVELNDNIFGVKYSMISSDYARVFNQCCEFYRVLQKVADNNIDLGELFKEAEKTKNFDAFTDLFDSEVNISYKCKQIFYRILFDMNKYDFEFYRIQNVKKNPNKEDIVKTLLDAGYKNSLNVRAARLLKLIKMGAPLIILANEFRMFTEKVLLMYNFVNGDLIEVDEKNFGSTFGVNLDGTPFDYSVFDNEEDEDTEECDESEEGEEKEEQVIGVDYPYFALVETPNFMMYDGDFVIFNNEIGEYHTDNDGNIMLWNVEDYKEARNMCDELNNSKLGC